MRRSLAVLALAGMLLLASCAKKESAEVTKTNPELTTVAGSGGAPHALVPLKDGNKVSGTIVASSQTQMVVAGDDGIELKIPMAQIKSVDYGETRPARSVFRSRHARTQRRGTHRIQPRQRPLRFRVPRRLR